MLLLCIKLLLDPFFQISSKAQESFNLVQLQSLPVSYSVIGLPSAITLGSLPVSFSLTKPADFIKLSSLPVSFNTNILPTTIKLSSLPVSYALSQSADFIKLSSLPVSYSLNSYTGELIKLSSSNVSYKIFNGIPILESVSPNLLPVLEDKRSINVAIKGDNFVVGSVVSIGTLKIHTKYNSQKELIATIPGNYLDKENSFELFVSNPPPEGGVSHGFNVMVIEAIPVAKINATPVIGVAPQIVTFDGRGTEDLLAKYFGQELSYSWDFGEGENETATENTSISAVATHKYMKPGKYLVTLNVLNAHNKTSKITKEIEIREKNFAPEGSFEVSQTTGDVPLTVLFTSKVTDKEDDPISYEWDFGDRENVSADGSNGVSATHTYTIPGKYNPKLTVTDSLGAKTTITSTLLTLLPPNNPPTIQLSAVPKESVLKQNLEGFFTSEVQFISNGTYDPDGEELTYEWDFNDGETSSEINPIHEYKNAGGYLAKLTVTDPRKGQSVKEIKVSVLKPNPNVIAKVDGSTGNAPFEVTFDGKSSHDFDGRAVTLTFDFGDGASETINSTQGIIKHTYQDPGVYLVTLIASTNDNRFTKINPAKIIVGPNNAPVGQITKLEGDERGVLGKAKVKLTARGSFDPLDTTLPLKYKWSWNAVTWTDGGNLIDISKEVNEELQVLNDKEEFEYTFTKAGQFTPVLEIEKSDGTKSKFFGETYTITTEQAPVAVAKVLSDKTDGEPGLEISFDGSESYDPKANGGLKIITWDFGDGEKSTEVSPKHIYNSEGTFTPTLVVVDNENNIGFAQAASVKITKQPTSSETNLLSRKVLFQTVDGGTDVTAYGSDSVTASGQLTEEEIKESIDSMTKEALVSYVSTDNIKPEIGPITIDPKIVRAGDVVKLSAFVRDNVALSNFGYTLLDQSGNIISGKVIDLIKGEDKVLHEEKFVVEEIPTKNLQNGIYRIRLTATDSSGNQIAPQKETNTNSNEEITVTFEVNNELSNNIVSTSDIVIEPTELLTGTEKEVRGRFLGNETASGERDYTIVKHNEENNETIYPYGSHIRGKNILLLGESETLPEKVSRNHVIMRKSVITKNIKLLTNSFSVTSVTGVTNPWISISPSSTNSLKLAVISEKDGYVGIGTQGSLVSKYYNSWYKTNVYVDNIKVGTIPWYYSAGISFTSDVSSTSKLVEFRPANSLGTDLPSETWTRNYFTFTKILKPEITSILPNERIAGRGAFDLTIYGNNFRDTSKVYFDSYSFYPQVSSSTSLTVRIPASFVSNIGFKQVYVINSDGSQSNIIYFTSKFNPDNPCNIDQTLPQTIYAGDKTTILDGGNVYVDSQYVTISGIGSVALPFCTDDTYQVQSGIGYYWAPDSPKCKTISYRLDGTFVGSSYICNPGLYWFSDVNTSSLAKGLHKLEVSYSGTQDDKLTVYFGRFLNSEGPVLESISPASLSLEGTNRQLNLNGRGFDSNTKVYIDNEQKNILSLSPKQITIPLPDKYPAPGTKSVYINSKLQKIISLTIRDKIEIVPDTFKVTPKEPFPGTNFDIELTAKDKLQIDDSTKYTAYIGVFDPDGELLTIPNISNNISTVTIDGVPTGSSGEQVINFRGSIPLDIKAKAGNYKVYVAVLRESPLGVDHSSLEAYSFIGRNALGFTNTNDSQIPPSHKLTFTPKPAVNTVFGIEENTSENVGFVVSANKIIQSTQKIKFKSQISTGAEYASNLRYNFKAGDGRESRLISSDSFDFIYNNPDIATTTPKTYFPKLDIFWVENGVQTKIATHNGPTVLVYPNYKPIAKARVFSEKYDTYATVPPLKTGFIDTGSYDPNQIFSNLLDFVNPIDNIWTLYKGRIGENENVISNPIDASISEDGKTFLSGSLFTPGTYFARLTVKDQTNQTDTASTESVTVTYPHQKVIVFATTDPADKKVYDPSTVILSASEGSPNGLPVKFMSNVTVLGGNPTLSYRWQFGDGSCSSDVIASDPSLRSGQAPQSPPLDCTDPNPTHYYFDNKRSFRGQTFVDRKSITPKLTVTARFPNGKSETWEASAGTITFNADPHFVLLDVKSDTNGGIVPLQVNLMIDPNAAKQINATVVKYEIYYGDENVIPAEAGIQGTTTSESGEITFDELLNKTFTHTYLAPGSYAPKLKVFIKESTKVFEFNVQAIIAGGSGTGGDDISNIQDGLVIEKEQGEILNIEKEVLMIDSSSPKLFREFRWKTVDEVSDPVGEGLFTNQTNENDIFIDYETPAGAYKLKLSQDLLDGSTIEKDFILVVKDVTQPEINELELTGGNVVAQTDEFSFHIEASDNAKLMALDYSFVNKIDNSVVFNGHEDLVGREISKDITLTIPETLQEGDYQLIAQVTDSTGNITTTTKNFDTDISILDKKYSEQVIALEPVLLTGNVSETFFALGAANSIFPVILPVLGLSFAANIFDFFNPSTYQDELKNDISDLTNNYSQEVDMILCGQYSRLLNQISNVGDLSVEENRLKAAKLTLGSSSKAKILLKNFENDLKSGGRLQLLNTQSASVTVVPKDHDFDIEVGGDRTKEFSMSFYLPHLISSTKQGINSVISSRAHYALSILFNNKDISDLFNKGINFLTTSEDKTYKLIDNAYNLIENSNDRPPEIVQAFISGDLIDVGINNLNDFSDTQINEKKIITSYVQRLLQDLGISGPTDGLFSQDQLAALDTLKGNSTSSSISPEDLKHIKDTASKTRSAYIGLRKKDILVTKDRLDGYSTFIGSLIGSLVSETQASNLTYLDLINIIKVGNTIDTIDNILARGINESTLNELSSKLAKKIITLISTLANEGDRRKKVINELIQVVQKLKDYVVQKGYISAKENLSGIEILLETYDLPILDRKEDNIGVLVNKHISKLNVYKEVFRNHEDEFYQNKIEITRTNNDLIGRRITTGIPLMLLSQVVERNDTLSQEDLKEILVTSSTAVKKKYAKTLLDRQSFENNDGIELNLLDIIDHPAFNEFSPVGKINKLIRHILKRVTIENDPRELNKLLKKLRHLARLSESDLQDRIIFPIAVESLSEITPNNKETEVVSYFIKEINSKLHPKLSSSQVPLNLILTLDANIANAIVQTRTIKQIVKDVFLNIYKDKVFVVDGVECKINETFDPNWIREIDTTLSTDYDVNTSYGKDTEIAERKRIINELGTITDLQRSTLTSEDLIPIDVSSNPITLYGGVSYCNKVNNKIIREVPSEFSSANNSFTFTVDSLGNPTSITLMTSISITNGAPSGISGSYSLLDTATGMIIHVEPFDVPDPIPIAKYVDLPVKTITGGALQTIINKLGSNILSGLIVIVKVAKPGSPLFVLAAEFLDPEPAGETIPDTFKKPQIAPYINCSPAIQTVTIGESTTINYIAGPTQVPQDVKVILSPSGVTKKVDNKGIILVTPNKDSSITFTATSPQGTSSTECIVNVTEKDKKPGQIDVNVDERFVKGYDVNGYPDYWKYPVEYKVDGKLAGEINYIINMSSSPTTVTPDQNHTVTLTVNGKDVDNQTKLVPSAPPPTSFSFNGGIWRKYTTASGVATSIGENTIKVTMAGDLGDGAYVTNLAVPPDGGTTVGTKSYEIARLLRLFKFRDDNNQQIYLSNGEAFSLTNPKPDDEKLLLGNPPDPKYYDFTRTNNFVDYLFGEYGTGKLYEKYNPLKETLKFQFMYPTGPDVSILNLGTDIPDGHIINGQ